MTNSQKEALDKYLPVYGIPFRKEKIDFSEFFSDDSAPILEIGCGKGEATIELAKRFPDTNFLAVEVYPSGIGKLLHEIHRSGINNLRLIKHDAVEVVEEMLDDESLKGVHVFFPDPWPKKKHHKRRLLQKDFARTLTMKIQSGGYFYVVTDWEDYAWDIVHTLGGIKELRNEYEVFAPSISWRPKTDYEQKGLKKDHLVREIFFVK